MGKADTCPALDIVQDRGWAIEMMKNATQLRKTNDNFKLNSE